MAVFSQICKNRSLNKRRLFGDPKKKAPAFLPAYLQSSGSVAGPAAGREWMWDIPKSHAPSFIPGHPENVGNPWAKAPNLAGFFVTSFYVTNVQLHPRWVASCCGLITEKLAAKQKKTGSNWLPLLIRWLIPGWWYTYPSEKYENQWGWLFPTEWKVIKFMFQSSPTRY